MPGPPPRSQQRPCAAQGDDGGERLPWLDGVAACEKRELPKARKALGKDQAVLLPVWCLRWTHDAIHSQMVFGQGRRQDASIFELVFDLLSGRQRPEEVEPLQVVLDEGCFYSLSNRRLAALHMFQSLRRFEVVRVPCIICSPDAPRCKEKYKESKTTTASLGHGLGVLLHTPKQEAYHMGRPLFRTTHEWCTQSEDMATPRIEDQSPAAQPPAQAREMTPPKSRKPISSHPHALQPQGHGPKCPPPSSAPTLAGATCGPPGKVASKAPPAGLCAPQPAEAGGRAAPGLAGCGGKPLPPPPADPPQPSASPGKALPPKAPPGLAAGPGRSAALGAAGGLGGLGLDGDKALEPEPLRRQPPPPPPAAPPAKVAPPPPPRAKAAPPPTQQAPVASLGQPEPPSTQPLDAQSSSSSAAGGPEPLGAHSVPAAEELEGNVGAARVPAEPPVVQVDSEDELGDRSESDGEAPDDGQEEAGGAFEYQAREECEAELAKPRALGKLADLRGKLVYGIFRCKSGSDFKGRRCRGEVLIERGPRALLGCRVHVIGTLNRNRAWDFDQCWARITLAKVGQGRGAAQPDDWRADMCERTTFYGRVARAEPSLAPRQTLIICLRSKLVRSMKSMTFRAINGKFPLITVPWEPTVDPPNLFELHVVEVLEWKGNLPRGRYVDAMRIGAQDASILRAVQISLNFCDWQSPLRTEDAAEDPPTPVVGAVRPPCTVEPGRTDLRGNNHKAICIEHAGRPASFALSLSEQGRWLEVHVVDVNSCLDAGPMSTLEDQMRRRAVGAWFLDYMEEPVMASLPLLPQESERALGFQSKEDRLAITFRFPVNPKSGVVDIDAGVHFESVVHCHELCTFGEAEQLLNFPDSSSATSSTLQALLKAVSKLENLASEEGWGCLFEHLEPNFVRGGEKLSGSVASLRIVAGACYLANRYAAKELSKAQAWSEIVRGDGEGARQALMPAYVRARTDPIARRAVSQLLLQSGQRPPDDEADPTVKDAIKALRLVVGLKDLSNRQKQCLQSAFLRQLRNSVPQGGYQVLTAAHWPQQTKGSHPQEDGGLFSRSPVFHIVNPLRRYLDLLGLRALKAARGWRPQQPHMRLSPEQLREAVLRTNARQEACHFAEGIFRQLSLMRAVEPAGWEIKDAIVSFVNPGSFQVLAPVGARAGVAMQLPVAALRVAHCTAEFHPESCSLAMSCYQGSELAPFQGARAQWTVAPWGRSRLSCVVVRNFAQPVRHHASLNAVIPSTVTFSAQVSGSCNRVQLSLGVGHRMYPEVFSTWPDLEKWLLVDTDISAYAQVWHGIRMCQTHAAAVASPVYSAKIPARVEWEASGRPDLCRCSVVQQHAAYGDRSIAPGDLAIISGSVKRGEAVHHGIYYGTVAAARPAGTQVKTRRCNAPGCSDAKCPFAHSEEEFRGVRYLVEVALSEISAKAKFAQQDLLRAVRPDSFVVQFVNVPLADRRSLEQIQNLPRYARASVVSPVLHYLTGARGPRQKREQQETRPLATIQQVERALRSPDFRVFDGGLNPRQQEGVKVGLQRSFSVVQGPPGTGKTTFLVHLAVAVLNVETDPTLEAWSQVRRSSQAQHVGGVLICTPSNHAADEVLGRLVNKTDIPHRHITRIYARSIEAAHGSRYKGGLHIDARPDFPIRKDLEEHALHFKTRCRPNIQPLHHQLSSDGHGTQVQQYNFNEAYEREEAVVLKESRIIVTTCTSACSHSALVKSSEKRTRFATVIIDEAAQATELDIVLPALLANERVVLVGDHKQLGPVVTENSLCRAYMGALETSMLERLYRSPNLLPANTMLDRQYRMHGSIRSFPSKQFYASKLEDDDSIGSQSMHPSVWPASEEHTVFVDCQHPHSMGTVIDVGRGRSRTATLVENNTSLKNEGEARLVAIACQRLLQRRVCSAVDMAVITPYRAQKQEIQDQLESFCGKEASNIAVGTVYALQGSERECIVISFVRSAAEGLALCQNAHATKSTDVVVGPSKKDEALRQICESHLGIVSNSKLLNVSLTRARQGLVIVGNTAVLSEGSQDFLDLTEHLRGRRCLLSEAEFRRLGS